MSVDVNVRNYLSSFKLKIEIVNVNTVKPVKVSDGHYRLYPLFMKYILTTEYKYGYEMGLYMSHDNYYRDFEYHLVDNMGNTVDSSTRFLVFGSKNTVIVTEDEVSYFNLYVKKKLWNE